ncbi:sigma-54-dependent Fis family transcriptional regulator [Geomonas sp. Red276]
METISPSSPAVLLADSDPETLSKYQQFLQEAGLANQVTLSDSRELLPFLAGRDAGVVLLDLEAPHLPGCELLAEVTANHPQTPVIVITAVSDPATAVSCMKNGAFDYHVKPIDGARVVASIRKALEMSSLRGEISRLSHSLLAGNHERSAAFAPIITRSPKMTALFGYLEAVAGTDQPVLITGETGVGKDLVARALHRLSGVQGRFVAINAGGLDDQMFADTLFGHKRGAFTGAGEVRDGMIVQAAGGTLFLDEIGELSPLSQVKLLRLLQEREYYPLGSDIPLRSSARIIVATNQHLEQLIVSGTFRKDLYYRLCAHHIHIPPLRERKEDIPLLLEFFLEKAARSLRLPKPSYRPELFNYLCSYHFPGNVRELRSVVFDAMARHKGGNLSMTSFRKVIGKAPAPTAAERSYCGDAPGFQLTGRFPTLKEMETYLIEEALQLAGGNQGAAAAMLGLTRQALNKRLCRR